MSQDIIQHFYQLIENQELSHAYLFTGDDYQRKIQVTINIIQALACQSKIQGQPCLECEWCQRAAANQLADVIYIQAEGQFIKVDQIRQLKDWLATSPLEASFKLAVIEQAERMNPAASNALLQFLEEPLPNVHMVLYAQEASSLLATIQSRVQKYHFPVVSRFETMEDLLQSGIKQQHAQIIANLSTTSLANLLENYDEATFSAWLKDLNSFYTYLIESNLMGMIHVQIRLKNYLTGQQAIDSLDYLLSLCHSSLLLDSGDKTAKIQDYFLKELHKNHPNMSLKLLNIYQEILKTKEYIMANVSPQLALERLVLSVCQS